MYVWSIKAEFLEREYMCVRERKSIYFFFINSPFEHDFKNYTLNFSFPPKKQLLKEQTNKNSHTFTVEVEI